MFNIINIFKKASLTCVGKIVYFLIAVPIILVVLHLLPWIHAAGEFHKTTLCTGAVFVVFFLICVASSPFNGDISPNRIVFNQEFNSSDALSTVALITGSAFGTLQKSLKQVLPSQEFETLKCESYLVHQTKCTYNTALTPLYGRNPDKEIDVLVFPPSHCLGDTCHVNITTIVQNSLLCQLQFSNQNISGLNAWVNGNHIKAEGNGTIHAITAYSKKEHSFVKWDLSFDADQREDIGEARFSCFYDDWTEGELPAFTTLRDNLPINNLLTIKGGVGLSKVRYSPSISLN